MFRPCNPWRNVNRGLADHTHKDNLPTGKDLEPVSYTHLDVYKRQGLIMSAVEIVGTGKKYNREELKKLISGHLCRCTGYENILNAMERIVEEVYQISHKTNS